MEPYAPIGGADPFAASMKLVTALVAELQAPGAAGLTACKLFTTRDMVDLETPATAATSCSPAKSS